MSIVRVVSSNATATSVLDSCQTEQPSVRAVRFRLRFTQRIRVCRAAERLALSSWEYLCTSSPDTASQTA